MVRLGPLENEPTQTIKNMILTPQQKRICERALNAFETDTADGDYGNIPIYGDGPGRIRQITYGRSQTTDYGHLSELVSMYVAADGELSKELKPYVNRMGKQALMNDAQVKQLLKRADKTPLMQLSNVYHE
jgi:chitosanase